MKKLGTFKIPFPETPAEAREWKPDTSWLALHTKILVAARTRVEGTWAAYIGPVPGMDHGEEFDEVLRHGAKLSEKLARVMFMGFDGIPYAK